MSKYSCSAYIYNIVSNILIPSLYCFVFTVSYVIVKVNRCVTNKIHTSMYRPTHHCGSGAVAMVCRVASLSRVRLCFCGRPSNDKLMYLEY